MQRYCNASNVAIPKSYEKGLPFNHCQYHLELCLGIESVGHVGRHDEHLACLYHELLAAYMDLSLAIHNLYNGVERSGMLAELLALVEGKEGDVACGVVGELLTHDATLGILDAVCDHERSFWSLNLFHVVYSKVVNIPR